MAATSGRRQESVRAKTVVVLMLPMLYIHLYSPTGDLPVCRGIDSQSATYRDRSVVLRGIVTLARI
eukprot:49796-Eustigmatos_ZCMA.PRE.1